MSPHLLDELPTPIIQTGRAPLRRAFWPDLSVHDRLKELLVLNMRERGRPCEDLKRRGRSQHASRGVGPYLVHRHGKAIYVSLLVRYPSSHVLRCHISGGSLLAGATSVSRMHIGGRVVVEFRKSKICKACHSLFVDQDIGLQTRYQRVRESYREYLQV